MRMLFEVNDLEVASPATVSRCGMVFMAQEDFDYNGYIQSWIYRTFGNFVKEKKGKPKLNEAEGLNQEEID